MNLRAVPLVLAAMVAFAVLLAPAAAGVAPEHPPAPTWASLDEMPRSVNLDQVTRVRPARFRAVRMNLVETEARLFNAPLDADIRGNARIRRAVEAAPLRISLPNPDGGETLFDVVEAPVMAPELAAKFPEIKTYRGVPSDGSVGHARIGITPNGLTAQVLSPDGAWYIDPYDEADASLHAVYRREDYRQVHRFVCLTGDLDLDQPAALAPGGLDPQDVSDPMALLSGSQLNTYRIAISATGEYTQFHGGTVANGLAAIVTTLNRVTGIYESELAISFELVANNDQIVYTSPGGDPFSNNNAGALIDQNQTTINSVIGAANYDIGHNVSTGGGGLASLGVVCSNNNKARGITGLPQPIGDPFDVDFVAHEIGHQFGATHTFNGVAGSCGGFNRTASTAYEPGSGYTVMAYAGICGSDNIANNSIPFFHFASYDQIRAYVGGFGGTCAGISSTGNTPPVVDAGPDYAIPSRTPFTLTATGDDPDGDTVTYSWEQADLGPASSLSAPDQGSIPLFISLVPSTSPSRTFPQLPQILSGTTDNREKLPVLSRTMDFRVTARDDDPVAGGVDFDEVALSVVNTGTAFAVTSPTGGDEWAAFETVMWNVAGTDAAPISTATVNILLSVDGGLTFPVMLAEDTPNDGSQQVQLPSVETADARIKVEPTDNIYFAINPGAFSISNVALDISVASAPNLVAPGEIREAVFSIVGGSEQLDPTTPTLFTSINDGPFVPMPLLNIDGQWVGSIPAAFCGDTITYYVSAESTEGTIASLPNLAPGETATIRVGSSGVGFFDSFQTDLGWSLSGDAGDGQWERGSPQGNGRSDPDTDFDGNNFCYLTDIDPNTVNSDVDGGSTTLTSPVLDLTGGADISYAYWFDDSAGTSIDGSDSFRVETSSDGGANWRTEVNYTTTSPNWRTDTRTIPPQFGGPNFRIRFTVTDGGSPSLVEGGLDAFEVSGQECENPPPACRSDYDGNGIVDAFDAFAISRDQSAGLIDADYNNSGLTSAADLAAYFADFGLDCD